MIVYTANFGRYDYLNPPTKRSMQRPKDVRFVRFIDQAVPKDHQGWENIVFKPEPGTGVYTMKWLKLFPHRVFDDDRFIWMDANCMMRWNPWEIWNEVMDSDKYTAGFYCHPFIDNVYDEMKRVKNWNVEDPERVERMMRDYQAKEVPPYTAMGAGTTTFFRKHNNNKIDRFGSMWWEQIMEYHARDQCSLAYVRHMLKDEMHIKIMPRHLSDFSVNRYAYFSHAARERWDWRTIKRHPDPRVEGLAEILRATRKSPWYHRLYQQLSRV